MNRTTRIRTLAPQDRQLWQTLFYRHQQQSRRRRLLALKAIWDGQSMIAVCRALAIQRKTLEGWLDTYLHGGFEALLAAQKRPRAQTLSPTRRKILRYVLLHKTPADDGIDSHQWTARCVQQWLGQKWQVSLSATRLYEIFDELGLSHQRAHRDYGPGRPGERADDLAALKKTPAKPGRTPPWSPSMSLP